MNTKEVLKALKKEMDNESGCFLIAYLFDIDKKTGNGKMATFARGTKEQVIANVCYTIADICREVDTNKEEIDEMYSRVFDSRGNYLPEKPNRHFVTIDFDKLLKQEKA